MGEMPLRPVEVYGNMGPHDIRSKTPTSNIIFGDCFAVHTSGCSHGYPVYRKSNVHGLLAKDMVYEGVTLQLSVLEALFPVTIHVSPRDVATSGDIFG